MVMPLISSGRPRSQARRTVLLTFAFATERHATQALATLKRRDDLLETVHRPGHEPTSADLALVDLEVTPANRDPVVTLASGLHGILVHAEDRVARVA